MEPEIFSKLWELGPIVALLGYIAWSLRGDSKEDKKALIDIYATKLQEMTTALNKSTEVMANVAKTNEAQAQAMEAQARASESIARELANLKGRNV